MHRRLSILGWHNVTASPCFPAAPGAGALGIEHQLSLLKRLMTPVPLRHALQLLEAGEPLPPRAVALTFDDGYQDSLDVAVPLLERWDMPATFFLVPGILSREVRPWWEVLAGAFAISSEAAVQWRGRDLPTRGTTGWQSFRWVAERLKEVDQATREREVDWLLELLRAESGVSDHSLFLDWSGAQSLTSRGFEVGSHTMCHAILSRETPEDQVVDLTQARRVLTDRLGGPMDLLAYPNGRKADHNAATTAAAKIAGYSHGFRTIPGFNTASTQPYEHPRFMLRPDRSFSGMLIRRVARAMAARGSRATASSDVVVDTSEAQTDPSA